MSVNATGFTGAGITVSRAPGAGWVQDVVIEGCATFKNPGKLLIVIIHLIVPNALPQLKGRRLFEQGNLILKAGAVDFFI